MLDEWVLTTKVGTSRGSLVLCQRLTSILSSATARLLETGHGGQPSHLIPVNSSPQITLFPTIYFR